MINILRDVKEDASIGRVYLPEEILQKHGIDSKSFKLDFPDKNKWASFVKEWALRCNEELENAKPLFNLLPRDSRYSPAVMVALYKRILKRIIRRPLSIFRKRIRVPVIQKIAIAITTALRIRLQPADPKLQK